MADTEDLSKLTACGLVLLGQMFLHMGRTHEVLGMVTPALQLAQKIPEVNIQLWGTALLRGTELFIYTLYFFTTTFPSYYLQELCYL